ncbi:phage tail protein [Halobacteriovorax sp. GB3]|uniref:phage tail protein n=1 Tax=Halobacteriovorax sp. GB3 TaxID=2719615 RepID=UPI00235F49BF|nr:phage tail protein [Halobacteriovorax sp. GB3]MDD0852978.1 phage tail protein [Halobacteriovorax sp. GB3]
MHYETESRRLTRLIDNASEAIVKKASRRAMSRTATHLRKESSKKVKESMPGAKAKETKSAIDLVKKLRGPLETFEAGVVVEHKDSPISNFKHRQTKKGVSVRIKNKALLKGAFIATMKNGHESIFKREGKKRLGIKKLFTSTIREAIGDKEAEIYNSGSKFMRKQLTSALKYYLSKI